MKTNRAAFKSLHSYASLLAPLALILASAFDAPAQPVITNAPGYAITWDGNNGDNPVSPTVPTNIALASQGAVAYASGQLGPQIGAAFHYVTNLNDDFYGNTKSWIGGTNDPAPWFAGIQLPATVPLTGIAWGRDNTGVSQDRSLGTYTVQIATNASFTTNASAWTTLGTITYTNSAAGFAPSLRHRFKLALATGGQIFATGVRLLVPDSGLVATGTDIDELELFRSAAVNLAYWRMGENDPGAVVGLAVSTTDLVQGRTMTFSGGPFYSASAATQVGSALSVQFFNGTYGTNSLITTLTDNFGLELWVKPDATNGVQCLAYNGTTGGGGAGGWGIYLINGQYTGLFGGLTTVGGAPATPGVWTHLALVRNNGTSTLYVNGNPAGTSPATPDLPQGRFALAAQPQSLNTEFFSGALDEVRVFSFVPGAFSTSELLLPVLPPTVTTAAATDIGRTNATLNGTVNPQNLTTATWFEWGLTTTYGNYTATNTLAATNQFFALTNSLTGLAANLAYHFRLAASNALGVSFGSDQSFTTVTFNLVSIPGLIGADGDLAWGDYDNDGLLDFLIVGRNGSQLMRNTGSGFTNVPIPGLSGFFGGRAAWGDFDNDGDLDFLVAGGVVFVGDQTQLWRNNGDGTFSNVTASLALGMAGATFGCVAWGDYDNDGRLDFLLTGRNNVTGGATQLWRNTGNGFTNVTASAAPGLPALEESSAAWGDYDNDGRLDFLIAGSYLDAFFINLLQLWHNTGNGFELAPLPSLQLFVSPDVAWADYDNDGKLDFIYSAGNVTHLCRNTGNGFQTVTAPPITKDGEPTPVTWGDFDNDGRLDLMAATQIYVDFPIFDVVPVTQLWRNTTNGFVNVPFPGLVNSYIGKSAWGDYDNDGRLDLFLVGSDSNPTAQLWHNTASVTNTPPSAPTGLKLTATTNAVMLSWNSATDAQTPTTGLTYNVRAGSTPGGIDLFAGHVNATNGFRRVPAMGNASLRHSLPLSGLTNGQTVYWSVQALDTSFAGGPFATETSVVTIPTLAIAASNATNALVSWTPPTFGWRLQERTNWSVGAWSDSASGELNPATVPATNAAQFYRLMNP